MKIVEYVAYALTPILIVLILVSGTKKKIPIYETFVSGATEAFSMVIRIFPSMLAIMLAINVFKASGAMNALIGCISPLTRLLGIPAEVVPIGVMRSVSGSGALGVLTDILKNDGPDSLVGKIASTIMGSSDTTLYVLAIYTSTVKISKTKKALVIGLVCDVVAVIVACLYWGARNARLKRMKNGAFRIVLVARCSRRNKLRDLSISYAIDIKSLRCCSSFEKSHVRIS